MKKKTFISSELFENDTGNWFWKSLRSCDFNEAIVRISKYDHWVYALPLIDVTKEQADKFLKGFDEPISNYQRRSLAITGTVANRCREELAIVAMLRRISEKSRDGQLTQRESFDFKNTLAFYMIDCVDKPDGWKSLERMIKVLKDKIPEEGGRGGELSNEGQLWRNFCQIHLDSMCLPSRKQLRASMHLKSDSEKADFSKWLRSLGLSGLPD